MAENESSEPSADGLSDKQREQLLQILITEHNALQAARSSTIFDSTGRATLFLTSVSSSLVALAFIGQVSEMSMEFYAVALVLFPTLFFLGVSTYERTLQSSIEDGLYAKGLSRIRHYYVEIVPPVKDYLVQPTHDDMMSVLAGITVHASRWQTYLTTAGMVSVINSVLAGVVGALLASWIGAGSLWLGLGAGVVVFFVSMAGHSKRMQVVWTEFDREHPPRFPDPEMETSNEA